MSIDVYNRAEHSDSINYSNSNIKNFETDCFKYKLIRDKDGVEGYLIIAKAQAKEFISKSEYNGYPVISMENTFSCSNFKRIDTSNIDMSNIKTMHNAFLQSKCTDVIINNPESRNIEIMSNLFKDCKSLTNVDIKLDTNKVKTMSRMFEGNDKLQSLDLKELDTQNVESMKCMFSNCTHLKSVNLSSFKCTKLKDISYMFNDCNKLEEIDLKGIRMSEYNMHGMCYDCDSLKSLDIRNFEVQNKLSQNSILNGCKSIEYINIQNINSLTTLTKELIKELSVNFLLYRYGKRAVIVVSNEEIANFIQKYLQSSYSNIINIPYLQVIKSDIKDFKDIKTFCSLIGVTTGIVIAGPSD